MSELTEKNKKKISKQLYDDAQYLRKEGFKVFGVFLQGSQNYGLSYEGSDIDTKSIILPSFRDLCLNKKEFSTTHVRKNGSHLDIKDIRGMFACFLKSNINFLEIIFTDYYRINAGYSIFWRTIQNHGEDFANYNRYRMVMSICGDILEKHKRLLKDTETTHDFVAKYGYNAKELHHMMRLEEFLKRWYIDGESFKNCLKSKKADELIAVKNSSNPKYNVHEAVILGDEIADRIRTFRDDFIEHNTAEPNKKTEELLNNILVDILRTYYEESGME